MIDIIYRLCKERQTQTNMKGGEYKRTKKTKPSKTRKFTNFGQGVKQIPS